MADVKLSGTDGGDAGSAAAGGTIDILEHGRAPDGSTLSLDRRLFMQLLAYRGCADVAALADALGQAGIHGVLYRDINDPRGVAVLAFSEDPDYFVGEVRDVLNRPPFSTLVFKPEYAMLGRTYAIGYEPNLVEALIDRPRRRVLDPGLKWAVWYPLRRAGSFEQLSPAEQRVVLMEHGGVGHAYGEAGLAYDLRLACHGLGKDDNDFMIGLVGGKLHPLSSVVQRMRKTRQTSLHLDRLGPFFVGRVAWQSAAAP